MLQDQPRHQAFSAGRCPNNRGRLFAPLAQKQRNTTLSNKMKLNRRDVAQTPLLKPKHAQLP
jgi:hypothetical protein